MPKSSISAKEKKPSPTNGSYAIVETSGQQFWLQNDRYYDLDRIKAEVDQTVVIENVLLINDGKKTTLGKPYVKGASVKLKVLAHKRGPKILVYKMRPKKKTRRKNGHRQELTRVMVESISLGKATASKATANERSKVKEAKEPQSTKASKKSEKTTSTK